MKLLIFTKELFHFTSGLSIQNQLMNQLTYKKAFQLKNHLHQKNYLKLVQESMFLLKRNPLKMCLTLLKSSRVSTKNSSLLTLMITLVCMMENK